MTTTAYAMVSLVRYRELKIRIALAAFIGFAVWGCLARGQAETNA